MSTTTLKPVTTPIPVQLSEPEFSAFILPHLSMPKRGPKCKLGYYRVFNLILRVLYTGMQWKCLPVPHDAQGKPAIHYTTVYKVFARWAQIPPNYVVVAIPAHRKPPDVRICRLSIQSDVGTRPPSTSTPHLPAFRARRW